MRSATATAAAAAFLTLADRRVNVLYQRCQQRRPKTRIVLFTTQSQYGSSTLPPPSTLPLHLANATGPTGADPVGVCVFPSTGPTGAHQTRIILYIAFGFFPLLHLALQFAPSLLLRSIALHAHRVLTVPLLVCVINKTTLLYTITRVNSYIYILI